MDFLTYSRPLATDSTQKIQFVCLKLTTIEPYTINLRYEIHFCQFKWKSRGFFIIKWMSSSQLFFDCPVLDKLNEVLLHHKTDKLDYLSDF